MQLRRKTIEDMIQELALLFGVPYCSGFLTIRGSLLFGVPYYTWLSWDTISMHFLFYSGGFFKKNLANSSVRTCKFDMKNYWAKLAKLLQTKILGARHLATGLATRSGWLGGENLFFADAVTQMGPALIFLHAIFLGRRFEAVNR